MSQKLKAAEGNVPQCTQPRSCGHVAAPKTDPCPAHFSQATRCRAAGHQSAGGRRPEIHAVGKCAHDVTARRRMCRPLLWRQVRVCVWPDAPFGRVQATRPCHTHLRPRHHERASSNRKATSDLRCHASQTDPQTHSRGSLTHPAHKIGGIPAADSPSIIRRRSGLSATTLTIRAGMSPTTANRPRTQAPTHVPPCKNGLGQLRQAHRPRWARRGSLRDADGPNQRAGMPRLAT